MEIQIVDRQVPLTAVMSEARASQDPLLPTWRTDLIAMSVEVSRKYFGAQTEEAVRDGVQASIHLLSLGLLHSSSGASELLIWSQLMRSAGVRGVTRTGVELIKRCDALPMFASVNTAKELAPASYLMPFFRAAAVTGPERAYRQLCREIATRSEVKRSVDLATWFLTHTASGRAARRDMILAFGDESPEAESVIHYVLSLICGISTGIAFSEDIFNDEETEPGDDDFNLKIHRLPSKKWSEARKRYQEVLVKIPESLRPALVLGGQTWLERFVPKPGTSSKTLVEDESLMAALEEALATPPEKAAPPKTTAPKKGAPKKLSLMEAIKAATEKPAKKAAPQKTAAKKAAPKKAAAKPALKKSAKEA